MLKLRIDGEGSKPNWTPPSNDAAIGLPLLQSPLLRAALISRHHWMHVHCDGCSTSKAVDLTVIRRPQETALTAIAKSLKGQRGPQVPTARIVKLSDSHE